MNTGAAITTEAHGVLACALNHAGLRWCTGCLLPCFSASLHHVAGSSVQVTAHLQVRSAGGVDAADVAVEGQPRLPGHQAIFIILRSSLWSMLPLCSALHDGWGP